MHVSAGPFLLIYFEQFFTRTVWWVIPLVWLPVIGWLASISARRGLTSHQVTYALLGGVFVWTLLEYSLHRFLFHMETKSYWLVLSLSLSLSLPMHWKHHSVLELFSGWTLYTIFFMVAITSTQWMDYGLFSLLQQRLFCVYQYGPFHYSLIRVVKLY